MARRMADEGFRQIQWDTRYDPHIEPVNRYVDLLPVIKRLAAELGFEAVVVSDYPEEDQTGPGYWRSSTDQVLVTRNKAVLASKQLSEAAAAIEDRAGLPTFTDAHHNLLRILK